MSLIWLLPTVVAGMGLVAAVVMGFRAGEELGALRRQLQHLAELGPALAEVRTAGRALAQSLQKARRP